MSLGEISTPSTWFWFRSKVQGLGYAHFCIFQEASLDEDAATVDLEILFMCSFASSGFPYPLPFFLFLYKSYLTSILYTTFQL